MSDARGPVFDEAWFQKNDERIMDLHRLIARRRRIRFIKFGIGVFCLGLFVVGGLKGIALLVDHFSLAYVNAYIAPIIDLGFCLVLIIAAIVVTGIVSELFDLFFPLPAVE